MRAVLLSLGSILLTFTVIGNAYYQKKQFYPSVVYITKSNPSMAVIYLQAFVLVLLMGKLMRKIFFGQLRAAEMEHLIERSWYAVTETCLAFTVFRDDFSPKFVALFTLLLFLKCFHWLAEDRVDYMERSPVISWLFHIRVSCVNFCVNLTVSFTLILSCFWLPCADGYLNTTGILFALLFLLGVLDFFFVNLAYHSTIAKGASVQLVFGFEYAILLSVVVNIFLKYALHSYDLQSENPWENKAVFLLYSELVMGLFKVVLYLMFMTIMIKIHTFPLFAIRPMYLSLRSWPREFRNTVEWRSFLQEISGYNYRAFKKAVNDVIMSRRAIRNMNTLYPDATAEELATVDNVCIICREEMSGSGSSKKLPCNHIFHASCLRSWFQRQQTCPTCRMDVLRVTTPPNVQNNIPAGAPQQPPPQAANMGPAFIPGAFPGPFPFMFPQIIPQQQIPTPDQVPASSSGSQQQQQPGTSSSNLSGGATASGSPSTSSSQNTSTTTNPVFIPPFPYMPFLLPPPPPIPAADLSSLSLEELQALEGQERENIEARIRCLRNIQTLLDGAVLQMQQYSSIVASLRTVNASPANQASANSSNPSKSENVPTMNGGHIKTDHLQSPPASTDEEVRRRRIQRFYPEAEASSSGQNNDNQERPA